MALNGTGGLEADSVASSVLRPAWRCRPAFEAWHVFCGPSPLEGWAASKFDDGSAATGVPLLDGLVGLAGGGSAITASSLLLYASAATGAYALWEQLRFRMARQRKDGKLVPGPDRVTPFIGGLVEMVLDPFSFWEKQKDACNVSSPGYSYNSLAGKMIMTVTDADKCRELMAVNDPQRMLMVLHPSAKTILGANNLAFMHGPGHKAIRKSFLSLFTRKALSTYTQVQDGVIRSHLARWLQLEPGTREIREHCRDLNQATSQDVFLGPYLDDPLVRATFSQSYTDMTDGFLAFPVCLPGTAVWRARKGRLYIFKVLKMAATRAREHIKGGNEPRCLMDFWAQKCLEEIAEAEAEGLPPPDHTTVARMADAMIDFLFASQDASTASLVWCLTLMADHPDMLQRVREEQLRLRPDPSHKISAEVLGEMTYTRQVVKEILRYRAPAPMVPQMAYTDYPLTQEYSIPRGTLGFPDAQRFDPDRMSPERKEDIIHAKNFLTFGYGPHYCVGKEYAINQLVLFLAITALECDWTRTRTPESDKMKYLPTIYPHDSLISIKPRLPAHRELAGTSETTVSLEDGSSTKTLLLLLFQQYPQLEELRGNFVFSLNHEYLGTDEEQQLKAGDEKMLRGLAVRAARRGSALAAQQQRGFAEAAVATQTSVWDELSDLVSSDEGKRELATLRSTYADIAHKLTSMAKDQPEINWQEWQKEIDPKLVQQFKQTYETMKLPTYEGNDIDEAATQFAELQKEAEQLVAFSKNRIVEIEAEIVNIQKEKKRIATTTIDDELAADPEMAKEVDAEVRENHFMVV
ncbi:Cytochrome P450 710A2 [Chlorella vulgaris]